MWPHFLMDRSGRLNYDGEDILLPEGADSPALLFNSNAKSHPIQHI